MAVIRDVMPAFELFQPASIDDALELLDRHGSTRGCWPADSTASTGSRTASSVRSVVVDLGGDRRAEGHPAAADGLEIGAMTTLTEVVRHPVVRERTASC